MKTTLKITMLLLAATLPAVAFAGLLGFPASGALAANLFIAVYAMAGLMLLGSTDYTARRTLREPAVRTAAARSVAAAPCRAYGLRRACVAA